jgi:hypothetical protein
MDAPTKTTFSDWLYRVIHGNLRLLLGGLLCVFLALQLIYIAILWIGPQKALPKKYQQQIHDFFAEYRLSFTAKRITISPNLTLQIQGCELFDLRSAMKIASAQTVYAQLSFWDLLFGKIALRHLGAEYVNLYSYRATNNPVFAQVRQAVFSWTLRNGWMFDLKGTCAGIPVRMHGQVPFSWLTADSDSSWHFDYLRAEYFLDNLSIWSSQHLTAPRIWANIRDNFAHVEACCSEIEHLNLSLGFSIVTFSLINNKGHWVIKDHYTLASEKGNRLDLSFERLLVKGTPTDDSLMEFPRCLGRVDFFTRRSVWRTVSFHGPLGILGRWEDTSVTSLFMLGRNSGWLELWGKFDLEGSDHFADFETLFDPEVFKPCFLDAFFWPYLNEVRFLKAPIRIKGECFIANRDPVWIKAQASVLNISIHGTPVLEADAAFSYEAGQLKVDSLVALGRDWRAFGSYEHRLIDKVGHFSFHGSLPPTFLNPWLPGWWTLIWDDFRFKGAWPSGQIEIYVPWKDPQHFWLYGRGTGFNFSYKNVFIPKASLGLRIQWNDIGLNYIFVEDAGRTAQASLRILFDDEKPNPIEVDLSAKSNVALRYAGVFEEAKQVADYFEPTAMPYVDLKGQFYPYEETRNYLDLKLETLNPIIFKDIQLDRLAFTATLRGNQIAAHDIVFGLAQGHGTASLDLTHTPPQSLAHLSLDLKSAYRTFLIEALGPLNVLEHKTNSAKLVPRKLEPPKGILHLNFIGNGFIEEPLNWSGNGSVFLREKDLGNIHFFGPVSRLIKSVLIIPIGSLELDTAQGAFTMNNGYVNFPDASLKGLTSYVDVMGRVHLEDQALDFEIKLYPFGCVPVLSTAMILFRPLSHIFKVHLSGTLSEPQWNLGSVEATSDDLNPKIYEP